MNLKRAGCQVHISRSLVISALLCDHRNGRFAILVLDSVTYTNSIAAINFKRAPASRGGQTLPDSPFKVCAGNKRSLTFSIPPIRA
jgi:hypothetical protein